MFSKTNKILLAIFLLAFALRVYRVVEIPYGFDGDEAAFGYYGYSLLTNLSDEYANKLPLYFPSIGDYKYPVYAYLTAVSVSLLGLSIFSARFVSIFAGSLLSVIAFSLVRELSSNKKLAYLSAIFVAVSPYSIIFSRGAYESNLAVSLAAASILFFTLWLKKSTRKNLILFLGLFLVSIYTYSAMRVFFLAFIPLTLLFSKLSNNLKYFKKSVVLYLFLVIVIAISFIDARSRVRANDIGIFRDNTYVSLQEEYIHEDGLVFTDTKVTRALHGKPAMFATSFLKRYLSHISPIYLFMEANPVLDKYAVRGIGLMHFFEIVTFFAGLVMINKQKKSFNLFIPWLIASFIPSSLTIETPNPIRSLISVVPLGVISALGSYYLHEVVSKRLGKFKTAFVFLVIVCSSVFYFFHQYFIHDQYYRPWVTDGGVTEMFASVKKLEDKFEKIVFTEDPYIFDLFYNKVSPSDFIKNSDIEAEELGRWERVNSFGKHVYKMPINCPKIGKPNVLYVCEGEEVPINGVLHDVIRFKDSVPAFLLIEFVPYSERPNATLPEGVHYMVETDLAFKEALLSPDDDRLW